MIDVYDEADARRVAWGVYVAPEVIRLSAAAIFSGAEANRSPQRRSRDGEVAPDPYTELRAEHPSGA